MRVKKDMIANVSVLPRRLSLTGARAKLASNSYGVVITGAGRPLAVVKGTDLATLQNRGVKTLTQAIKHLESPLITGSQVDPKTVADIVLKQMRRKTSGRVRLPPTVILDKKGVAGIFRNTRMIDLIGESPDVEIPKTGRFKGQIRFGQQKAFRALVFGVGPPTDKGLGGPGRSTQVICAEPFCGYVNTVFRVPKSGSKKRCQNPEPPSHFLKIGR